MGSELITTIEGDILVRDGSVPGGLDQTAFLDARLADPSRLWPSGVVEFKFYHTFPAANKKMVLRAMQYISSKVSCITFREATEAAEDYVLIRDGLKCNSELGRRGGRTKTELEQVQQTQKENL